VAVVASFYATMVAVLAVLILTFGSARLLGPGFRRTLLLVSVVMLAGLAVYQLVTSVRYFGAA
jgi:hypothetical protein